MEKLTAWLVTIIGLVLAIAALGIYEIPYSDVIIAVIVLVIGIVALVKNYKR